MWMCNGSIFSSGGLGMAKAKDDLSETKLQMHETQNEKQHLTEISVSHGRGAVQHCHRNSGLTTYNTGSAVLAFIEINGSLASRFGDCFSASSNQLARCPSSLPRSSAIPFP